MAQVLESLQLKWDPGRSSWLLASTWTSLSCCQHLRSISLDERFLVPTVALPFRHKSIFKKKQHFYLLSLQQYGAQKACIVMLSKAFSLFYLPAPWVKASHSQDIDGLLWEAWYAMRNHREVEGPPRRTQTLSNECAGTLSCILQSLRTMEETSSIYNIYILLWHSQVRKDT